MSYNITKVQLREKDKVKLMCPNIDCGHKWIYRGKSKFYASCPFCRTNVHVFKDKLRNLCVGHSPKLSPGIEHCDSNIPDSSGGTLS